MQQELMMVDYPYNFTTKKNINGRTYSKPDMSIQKKIKIKQSKPSQKKGPPGKIKLVDAMRQLLGIKDLHSITINEISKISGINEALIYRYFGDKRGLMHQVLTDYLEETLSQINEDLKGVKGSLKRLMVIIRDTFDAYCNSRVFARIILVEVRNFPGYFESDTYQLVRRYSQLLLDIIKEGMAESEIRDDISPEAMRDMVLGGIEHLMLPSLFFERDVSPEVFSQNLFEVVINGIAKKKGRVAKKSAGEGKGTRG